MDVHENEKWGVGSKAKDKSYATVLLGEEEAELVFGEHPHSRRDNNEYLRTKDGAIYGFDGHRSLIDFEFKSYNYLKMSELSGDEVRKGGTCKIFVNRKPVFELFFCEWKDALESAKTKVQELMSLPIWMELTKENPSFTGKTVYYKRTPGVIESYIPEQGCIIWVSANGLYPAYDPRNKNYKDDEGGFKIEITSPDITGIA